MPLPRPGRAVLPPADPRRRARPRALAAAARSRLALATRPPGPGELLAPTARRRPLLRHPRRTARQAAVALLAWLALSGSGPGSGDAAPGDAVDAVVVRRSVPAGTPVGAADVAVAAVPTDLVPDGGQRVVADVVGRTATTDLVVGEVVVARRLAPEGLEGVAATLPAGRRAVPVPLTGPVPGLAVGHHVDLLAPSAASTTPSARPVARDAVVLTVDGEVALMSVADDEAPAVAGAAATGALVPAIAGAAR